MILKNLIELYFGAQAAMQQADKEEYKGPVLYMLSDASSYMTGATVIADGGRSCW